MTPLDAVVVGTGPNGLAAGLVLSRAGFGVELVEGGATPGGGCRTEERTLSGFLHDTCSTVQSLVPLSPFFRDVDVATRGVELLAPPLALAHPLDDGRAAHVERSVDDTARALGADGPAYRSLMEPVVRHASTLVPTVLSPIRSLPSDPLSAARFAAIGAQPLTRVARRFTTPAARALLAGVGAHATMPLSAPLTTGFALVLLCAAHEGGWPVVRGGSERIVDALVAMLRDGGATVRTGEWVTDLGELGPARVTLLDTPPSALARLAGDRLTARSRHALLAFRHAPGVCKVDWALSGPVPWRAEPCRRTCTVHVGGTFEEIASAEADVARGVHPERPFCIVVQPGVVDPSRAPGDAQTLWGYCHVPNGSSLDVTDAIEAQIERFAPGFKDLVLAKVTTTAAELERKNPNCVGGDVSGGLPTLRQTLARPTPRWHPYRTGLEGVFLCSASTPPGGGVHGMCGTWAARDALRLLGRT